MKGWEALLRAKVLRARAALSWLLLHPAKVVLRLLASTALREARLATGHHWVACPIGPMHLLLETASHQKLKLFRCPFRKSLPL